MTSLETCLLSSFYTEWYNGTSALTGLADLPSACAKRELDLRATSFGLSLPHIRAVSLLEGQQTRTAPVADVCRPRHVTIGRDDCARTAPSLPAGRPALLRRLLLNHHYSLWIENPDSTTTLLDTQSLQPSHHRDRR